ncbi:MFS transporter [Gilliamella sp. wkB108]|uniref:oligosaccharide MFS transporter n=1 Tax=Gilliamella sp. wkB108 TaxID=3120256 RepID=UPI00080E6273|nr:oligosaccharide MFS transporter [Gilliamella apicola]OCG22469.1 MFS transporter [Gilliamella apicola]
MKLTQQFTNKNYLFSSSYLLFFYAAWSLWWSFYAIWLKTKLGLSGVELGMLYSTNQLISMVYMVCYGIMQDKLGTRKVIIWFQGFVLLLTGPFLIYAYEPLLLSSFKVGVVIGGLFLGAGFIAGCALTESFVEKLSRKFNFEYGTARMWGSFGYAVGALVGGICFSINPHINFWFVSIMGILFIMINIFYKINIDEEERSQVKSIKMNDILAVFKTTQFWCFVLFIIGTMSFYNVYDQQLFPVFYTQHFADINDGYKVYGYLNSFQVFLEAAGMCVAPFLINRIGAKTALLSAAAIMATRMLGSAVFTDVYLISFIKLLHAAEVPLFMVSIFKYIVANFDSRLSSTIFLIGFKISSSVGVIILSSPVGKLFDMFGYHSTFYILAAIVTTIIVVSVFTLSNKKIVTTASA